MNPRDFDPDEFDSLLRHFLGTSKQHPVILEVFNDYIQYLVFIREEQLYWAGICGAGGFSEISIRKFFLQLRKIQFPKVVVYQTSLFLYHSLLVYLQKKPDLKVNSTLVDIDDLLDRAEKENNSALVTAFQPGNLIMLRYQGGEPIASYHGCCEGRCSEANPRDEFLVKIYTLSAHRSFEIKLFTDLAVTHSEDARAVSAGYQGTLSSFYLSQPPKLILRLKNRPLKTYTFTGKEISIGRSQHNNIVIDNLSVSRRHTVISSTNEGYELQDLESKNGTFLNGRQVDKARLKNDDIITIGKYQLVFQEQYGDESSVQSMDQTVIIPNYHSKEPDADLNINFSAPAQVAPRLYRRSTHEEHLLEKENTIIGRGKDSDIRLLGLFAPRAAMKITRQGSDYILKKLNGRKKLNINGEEMDEKILEEEDLIAIGSEEFVFKR